MSDSGPARARQVSAPAPGVRTERRRFTQFGDLVPVPVIVDQSLRGAELQLLDAREALKDARRRVVQLEDALEGWRALKADIARVAENGTKVASR